MSESRDVTTGDVKTAVAHAVTLLARAPLKAEEQALEILRAYPEHDAATQVLAAACRLQGDAPRALALLEPLAAKHPSVAQLQQELGMCLGVVGRGPAAIAALRRAVELDATNAAAWRSLGDQLAATGDESGSEQAYRQHLALVTRHPELVEAAEFLARGNVGEAERLSREVLKKDALDTAAMRILATVGVRLGKLEDASSLLERCLELAPDFHHARHNYATILLKRNEVEAALEEVEKLLQVEPDNPNYLILKATILGRKGDHAPALALYQTLLKNYPAHAGAHMNYGHTLKTVGQLEDAVAAYRSAIDLNPASGETYWSLANLKTFRFNDDDVRNMLAQVGRADINAEDQAHLAFALGKAYEDQKAYDESFRYYELGNRVRGEHHRHNAKINVFNTARQIKTFTAEFFAARQGWGCTAEDPIFIVGLPRAGSTLLEQILSSHSMVEGTAELPDIIAMSRRLGKRTRKNPASLYPEILQELTAAQARELGENYLETTRVQRHGGPYFIDKMPNNFQHIGLIHLILPKARIVDARRHPMAGCFSCFKQLFARGQTFTYSQEDLGKYYRDYLILMQHWNTVLPGRVHTVHYENMVTDTEGQIRAVLDYCGLPFEEACLRFYETERAIRTPSAEQVRQPVYQEGLEQWRYYEKHLGPLKKALGPAIDLYATV